MQIASGTYKLGELADVVVATSASAHVRITVKSLLVFDEVLYANASGNVMLYSLGYLLKPFCTFADSAVVVDVDGTRYELTVLYNLLSDGNDPILDVAKIEGVEPVRVFAARMADGNWAAVRVYGIETERPEYEKTMAKVADVERVVEGRYSVRHEILTTRLTGAEVRLLTGLAASGTVHLATIDGNTVTNGAKVVIDVDASIQKTLNNPQDERTATLTWRYADTNVARSEYTNAPTDAETMQSSLAFSLPPLATFSFGGHVLKVWGIDQQVREFACVEVIVGTSSEIPNKLLRIAHKISTGRMSRTELRALAVMLCAADVTLDGKPVVVDGNVEISSDPQSNRTAEFTWRWADVRIRTAEME